MNFPLQIEETAIYIADLTHDIDGIRARLETLNDRITSDVINARDPSGKPVHTNDTARDLAVRQLQRISAEWNDLNTALQHNQRSRAIALAKLERLRGEFCIWQIERQSTLVISRPIDAA